MLIRAAPAAAMVATARQRPPQLPQPPGAAGGASNSGGRHLLCSNRPPGAQLATLSQLHNSNSNNPGGRALRHRHRTVAGASIRVMDTSRDAALRTHCSS